MKGRKPKPTMVKLLAGNPGGRRLNEREPRPLLPPSLPDPPKHLSRDACKEWNRTGGILLRMRVLTEIDLSALAAYATIYGRWVEVERHIARTGIMVRPVPGSESVVQNPMLSVANRCLEQMRHFVGEFGLTPSSRTRIAAAPDWEDVEEMKKAARFLGPHPIRPAPPR